MPSVFLSAFFSGAVTVPPSRSNHVTSFFVSCSIVVVGEPWGAYLADKHIPVFVETFVALTPVIYLTVYVIAPVMGIFAHR